MGIMYWAMVASLITSIIGFLGLAVITLLILFTDNPPIENHYDGYGPDEYPKWWMK
jgi:hypothetical protein